MLLRIVKAFRLSDRDWSLPQTVRRGGHWLRYTAGRRRDAGTLALLATSRYFDSTYYLRRYQDVADSGMDPVVHYVDYGADELRHPSDLFDTAFYSKANPEIAVTGLNPLVHFLKHGRKANRPTRPEPTFVSKARSAAIRNPGPPPQSIYQAGSPSRGSRNRRYVVYSAVVGGYDDVPPPAYRPAGCDFVLFSDQPLKVTGWTTYPLNYHHPDPTRSARFVKLHPHLYFPEYEHSIWIDANIGVKGDVGLFIDRLSADEFIGALPHPLRDCIYLEGLECIMRRKDDASIITRHLERYRALEVPDNLGLWETNILARRHNDRRCIRLMAAWWREIQSGSRRDQLSLPVVQHQHSATIVPLDRKGVSARSHPLVTLAPHRARRSPADPNIFWQGKARQEANPDTPAKTIGICVHNSLKEVKACLSSVRTGTSMSDRIIVVDDASDEETARYLADVAASDPRICLKRNEENLGYTCSANLILRGADTPWVVLLNSDTIVPPEAFAKLVRAGEENPKLAIVGPLSNAASWQSVPRLTGPDGTFHVNALPRGIATEDMDVICEQAALPVTQFVPLVNGFCLAIRTSVLAEIGAFDEMSFPIGYGEEDDLCLRAADAGYVCGISTDTFVFHSKSASFTSDRRKLHVAEGLKALRRKHSQERLEAAAAMMRDHAGLKLVRERVGILQRRKRFGSR